MTPAPIPSQPRQDPPQSFWYTRTQKFGQGHQFSEIDFIASNRKLEYMDSLKKNEPLKTDHLLIFTSIESKLLQTESIPLRLKERRQIKGGLLEADFVRILQSTQWP